MINETVILLTYYYSPELHDHKLLKYLCLLGSLPPYLPFNLYLGKPLQKIFSKVILYDYLKRMAEIGVKAVNEEIIVLVRKEHPKYVIWTPWQYDIQESTLEIIRKGGSIVVGWFFDDEWRFDEYSKWWIPHLDYCVTNAIEAVPKYRELGARVVQTIPNTGVAIDYDWANIVEKYDVSFVGTIRYADREKYIDKLKRRAIPIHLFGTGSGAGYISFGEMVYIFKTSKINLNFSKEWIYLRSQIKGRVFQVCMAGGFMLTEYAPGVENYFEIDKEIVCFHNAEEMIDKINYYLNHDEERRAIARAGWERACREYTSSSMVARVFNEIEHDIQIGDRDSHVRLRTQELQMPILVRWRQSSYHFRWARALLGENCQKDLWKNSLALALAYNPFNIGTWYYSVVGSLPSQVRRILLTPYIAVDKLITAAVLLLGRVLYLRKMKRSVTRWVFHA